MMRESVQRKDRQLPIRSLSTTSRLLNSPAAYISHQSLPPMSSATLTPTNASTTTSCDAAGSKLRFSWTALMVQVCGFLRRGAAVEQLSVDECGAVGSFVSAEMRLHAVEMTSAHVAQFQPHVDELFEFMQKDVTSDAAVERIVRFLRSKLFDTAVGQGPDRCC